MRVYRLEDGQGTGIYRTNVAVMPGEHRPCPGSDFLGDWDEDAFFAFQSIDLMLQWFDDDFEVEQMEKWEVQVSEYEIDADLVRVGEHQCVFIKERAQLVDRYSYAEIYYADKAARQAA